MRQSRPRRRVRTAILAFGFSATVGLLAVEGLVRVFCDEPVQPRFVVDSGFGVRANQANARTSHIAPGEYDVAIRTNSSGMRGLREYPLERAAGVLRVVVLGDSFAFGHGVNDEEVVSARLEERLGQEVPGGAEVLNLAVSGFGEAEELITWRRKAAAYRPDVVVVFYFENDVGNNLVSGLFTLGRGGEPVPTGAEFLPGSRLQERLLAFPPTRFLFEHSRARNLLRNRLSATVLARATRGARARDVPRHHSGGDRADEGAARGARPGRARRRRPADLLRRPGRTYPRLQLSARAGGARAPRGRPRGRSGVPRAREIGRAHV